MQDCLKIDSLSSLGAKTSNELLNILAKHQENGIIVVSENERSIFDILAFAAELDAKYRSEKQRAATLKAWKNGNLRGRQTTMDRQLFAELYAEYKAGNLTLAEFGRRMDRQPQTIRNAIRRYEKAGSI